MRLKRVFIGLGIVLLSGTLAQADTLKLKDGSILKGKIIRFFNNEFTIVLPTLPVSSRIINANEIESIEFDGTDGSASAKNQSDSNLPPDDVEDSDSAAPRRAGTPGIRMVSVNVVGRDDWTSSGIVVTKGQRIRITATGLVDLGAGRKSGPEGIPVEDKDRLLPTYPTGSLIAVIGDDNDEFIFIGRAQEFVAERNGRLFLSVNEGNLKDNSGTLLVRVEVELAPAPVK